MQSVDRNEQDSTKVFSLHQQILQKDVGRMSRSNKVSLNIAMYKECSAGETASSHKQFMVEEQQTSEEALKWRIRYYYAANVSSRAGPR